MLIPFDMIAAMLYLGHYVGTPQTFLPSLSHALAILALCGLGLSLFSFALNRVALGELRRRGYAARRNVAFTVDVAARTALVGVYIACLNWSGLPWVAAKALGWDPNGILMTQLVGLVPYVAFFFCTWIPLYRLHRETNFGSWTRLSFIVHKARYNLFLLLAWIPFAFLAEWLSEFLIALPILFFVSAWTFPFLLAKLWGCRALRDEKTLAVIHDLEKRAGAGFSRVYLWEPGGGGIQNAAAVGILKPFRYLFLTPALVNNMHGDEFAAVVLHELGHVKKRHLLFYLFTSLAGINLAVMLGSAAPMIGGTERFVVTAVLVFAYFRLVFGWMSRNMERQADIFALEVSGSESGLTNALEKLGIAAGNIRQAASWHHLGIAERVDFLRAAEKDRRLLHFHHTKVALLKAVGYLTSVLLLVGMGWLIYAEYDGYYGSERLPAGAAVEAHWRRVMQIMPGNSTAHIELAHRLAKRPETRDEAAELAERAAQLARGGEEKAAASKLLEEIHAAGRNGTDGF